jgi:NitT/TauT family transport system substrate-binding protein
MSITRREFAYIGGTLTAALALPSTRVRAEELKTVRFGVGLKALNAIVINCMIGEQLGFNKAEGFMLKPMALGTNNNVQVALDRGDIDVGIGVPSTFLPIVAKGEWKGAKMFYEYTYPYKWDVAVLPGSKIASYQELKGKKIGVSSFGGTEYPVTRHVLSRLGIDPDKDVSWVSVGGGLPAGLALQGGVIDALAFYDTGFGQIEAANIKLTYLPRPANLPMIGGQFLMAPEGTVKNDPKLLVGVGRSIDKASRFLIANPEAGAAAFLKMVPQAAPRGASQEAAVKAIVQSITRRMQIYAPPYPNTKWGAINEQEFKTEAEMNKLTIKDFAPLYTNALIDQINDFDLAKLQAEAAGYKG